tara:strand:+ start:637 stop:1176 length:540 start_codon:yes stop_codon:yes gene_type:complete
MNLVPITKNLHEKLQIFCDKCKKLNYINNVSFKSMKLEWCKNWGEFFCIIHEKEIISVAGCHPLPEVSSNAWRIFFRSCDIPKTVIHKGLHKGTNHKARLYINKFIEYCPTNELYVTSNIDNKKYKEIVRNNKTLHLISKQKNPILENVGEIKLYDTNQTIWKLNIDIFQKKYEKYKDT